MKPVESFCRIALVTPIVIIWLAMAFLPMLAHADGKDKPKPEVMPPIVITHTAPAPAPDSNDRRLENAVGAALVSGLATTALRDTQYGNLKAFGLTVAGAAAIEAGHSGSFERRNVLWAVGGAAIGTVGTCTLLLKKNFVGCAVPF